MHRILEQRRFATLDTSAPEWNDHAVFRGRRQPGRTGPETVLPRSLPHEPVPKTFSPSSETTGTSKTVCTIVTCDESCCRASRPATSLACSMPPSRSCVGKAGSCPKPTAPGPPPTSSLKSSCGRSSPQSKTPARQSAPRNRCARRPADPPKSQSDDPLKGRSRRHHNARPIPHSQPPVNHQPFEHAWRAPSSACGKRNVWLYVPHIPAWAVVAEQVDAQR